MRDARYPSYREHFAQFCEGPCDSLLLALLGGFAALFAHHLLDELLVLCLVIVLGRFLGLLLGHYSIIPS